ncbi:TPA: hypothetical protein ACKP1B_004144 [Serratia fonticola]
MNQDRSHSLSSCAALLLTLFWLSSLPAAAQTALAPSAISIVAWPRMSAPEFGCYLEKNLGHRDKAFNCATRARQLLVYKKNFNPCDHSEHFHDGPEFPDSLARKIHPQAKRVTLQWQGGHLQAVIVTLKGKYNAAEVRAAFYLPEEGQELPDNILQVDIDDSNVLHDKPQTETDLRINGFDFMDAMDFCGGGN